MSRLLIAVVQQTEPMSARRQKGQAITVVPGVTK
jgi:hypothetical protein